MCVYIHVLLAPPSVLGAWLPFEYYLAEFILYYDPEVCFTNSSEGSWFARELQEIETCLMLVTTPQPVCMPYHPDHYHL